MSTLPADFTHLHVHSHYTLLGGAPAPEALVERARADGLTSLALADGGKLGFEKIYPLDAEFDALDDAPAELRDSRRYRDCGDFSIAGLARAIAADFGDDGLEIVVHSLANGSEVKNPLLETSRHGYLAAIGASAYSFTALVQQLGPLMRPGGSFVGLTYLAAERVVPGYGGGMSTAKAALESDTRVLAFEAGRKWGHRVNVISAGPFASRAASAIGFIGRMIEFYTANSPLPEALTAAEVGNTAAFLCSPLASGITGETLHVDKGYNTMAVPADVQGILDALARE